MSQRKFSAWRRVLWTGGALLAVWALDRIAAQAVNPYIYRILVLCGLNAILALSLNLVNGITGQFSIGHAGFMAVGAYTSAAFTVYAVPKIAGGLASDGLPAAAMFLVAILIGGVIAALAGFL